MREWCIDMPLSIKKYVLGFGNMFIYIFLYACVLNSTFDKKKSPQLGIPQGNNFQQNLSILYHNFFFMV